MSFGAFVRSIREERGLSSEAVASRVGVSPVHLGRVERGAKRPSLVLAVRLSRVLDFDLNVLKGALPSVTSDARAA